MRIALKPKISVPSLGTDLGNARLRLDVLVSEDIVPEIFVYERYPILKDSGIEYSDRFIAVAKPGDLEVLPVDGPDEENHLPFFRLSYVDITFNSPEILYEAYHDIVEEVTQLVQTLERLEDMQDEDLIIIESGS